MPRRCVKTHRVNLLGAPEIQPPLVGGLIYVARRKTPPKAVFLFPNQNARDNPTRGVILDARGRAI